MSAEPEEDIALYSDERKLRRFAMDVLREAFELRLTPFAARELAERWGLIIATEQDGRPWIEWTPTLLGDELNDLTH